jgi:hypothetical protein
MTMILYPFILGDHLSYLSLDNRPCFSFVLIRQAACLLGRKIRKDATIWGFWIREINTATGLDLGH